MPELVLVVPTTTYRADDFLDAARRLGADVVVATDHVSTLASVVGDRQVRVDLERPAAAARRIAEHVAGRDVAAVLGVDDRGVEVAARAASALGLRTNPPEAVARTRDKSAMRAALEGHAGVAQPDYRVVGADDDVAAAATALGCPVVVKPVSLSASRGVIRADDPGAAAAAAQRVRDVLARAGHDARGPLLVERYLPGEEVALEGLLTDGALRTLALFDKPDPLVGPYFEETLYVTPSRLPEATRAAICEAVQAATSGLGLVHGPVHAEVRVDGGEVALLEVAARTIGGRCARALRFGLGMPLEEVVVRHALGLPLHALVREGAASGVLMLPIPHAGVLTEVAGLDAARSVDGIEAIDLAVPRGEVVAPLPEGDRYLGFAFARGHTPEEVEASLRAALARLTVHIDPDGADSAAPTQVTACTSS